MKPRGTRGRTQGASIFFIGDLVASLLTTWVICAQQIRAVRLQVSEHTASAIAVAINYCVETRGLCWACWRANSASVPKSAVNRPIAPKKPGAVVKPGPCNPATQAD